MKTRQITAWVVAGVVMSTVFTSCKKNDDTATLPAIGGYNSSSDVASTNLVAFWPFEGNFTETKQNLSGTNNGASFTTGVNGQGQAYQGKGSSNVFFNTPGTAFAQLKSVTVSAWVAEPTQPVIIQRLLTRPVKARKVCSSYMIRQELHGTYFT